VHYNSARNRPEFFIFFLSSLTLSLARCHMHATVTSPRGGYSATSARDDSYFFSPLSHIHVTAYHCATPRLFEGNYVAGSHTPTTRLFQARTHARRFNVLFILLHASHRMISLLSQPSRVSVCSVFSSFPVQRASVLVHTSFPNSCRCSWCLQSFFSISRRWLEGKLRGKK
jgi:hypothetical protein